MGKLQVPYEEKIAELLTEGVPPEKVDLGKIMSDLGVYRECCRTNILNPGLFVEQGYAPSTKVIRAVKKPPPILTASKVLEAAAASGKGPDVQKPPERPEIRPEIRPIRTLSKETKRPKTPRPTQVATSQPLVSPRPIPVSSVSSIGTEISKEPLPPGDVILPPLNLEGINLQSLGDIDIPLVSYL